MHAKGRYLYKEFKQYGTQTQGEIPEYKKSRHSKRDVFKQRIQYCVVNKREERHELI